VLVVGCLVACLSTLVNKSFQKERADKRLSQGIGNETHEGSPGTWESGDRSRNALTNRVMSDAIGGSGPRFAKTYKSVKGVEDCDKLGGLVKRELIPRSLNQRRVNP
jgi:hypothetical protein